MEETGRRQRDRTDTGQVLIMVGHKRVAKCVKHDEPQHRAQCRNEKCRCDLNATSQIPTKKIDCRAHDNSPQQPHEVEQMSRRYIPSRINKCEIRWPDEFAQIKPNGTARDENPFDWAQERKHSPARSLMVPLPPHR